MQTINTNKRTMPIINYFAVDQTYYENFQSKNLIQIKIQKKVQLTIIQKIIQTYTI